MTKVKIERPQMKPFPPEPRYYSQEEVDAIVADLESRHQAEIAATIHNIQWLPLAKKLSGYFEAFGQQIHPNKIVLFIDRELEVSPVTPDAAKQALALKIAKARLEEVKKSCCYVTNTACTSTKDRIAELEAAVRELGGKL